MSVFCLSEEWLESVWWAFERDTFLMKDFTRLEFLRGCVPWVGERVGLGSFCELRRQGLETFFRIFFGDFRVEKGLTKLVAEIGRETFISELSIFCVSRTFGFLGSYIRLTFLLSFLVVREILCFGFSLEPRIF